MRLLQDFKSTVHNGIVIFLGGGGAVFRNFPASGCLQTPGKITQIGPGYTPVLCCDIADQTAGEAVVLVMTLEMHPPGQYRVVPGGGHCVSDGGHVLRQQGVVVENAKFMGQPSGRKLHREGTQSGALQ